MNDKTTSGPEDSVALNLRTISRKTRQQFKALCAQEGKTMEDKLIELIEHELTVSNIQMPTR